MLPRITCRHVDTSNRGKLRYYLRTKAAADAIKFTVEVGGSLTKVVASKTCWSFSPNAWKLFGFLKASVFCFLWVFEAWGSEVPFLFRRFVRNFGVPGAKIEDWRDSNQGELHNTVVMWYFDAMIGVAEDGNHKMQSFFSDFGPCQALKSEAPKYSCVGCSAWVLECWVFGPTIFHVFLWHLQ